LNQAIKSIGSLVMSPTVPPAAPGGAPHDAVSARVHAALATWSRRHAIPGLQYALALGGRIVFEHAGGTADALRGVAVATATAFNLYSITKPFTAAAALVAAHRGALDLDAPIAEACAMPALAACGTVREALLHRAGFPNPLPLRWVHAASDDAAFDEPAFVEARLQALHGRRTRRGRAAYSNLGYLAVGRSIARAGATGLRAAVQRDVLGSLVLPAGGRLGFQVGEGAAHGLLRRRSLLALLLGLMVDRRRVVEGRTAAWWQLGLHQVDGSAYGGLVGNARGLVAFGHAVLGLAPGLAPSVRAAMCASAPGPGPARTLAWFEGQLHGRRWLAHAGGGLGGYGELRLYPELGGVSVLLANTPGLRDHRWLDAIDEAWLGTPPSASPVGHQAPFAG
jgi:D-alanyl-D-alanine carboxypeptidase